MADSSGTISHKPSAISQADLFKVAPRWQPPGFREDVLTSEEKALLDILKVHVGRRRAIPAAELALVDGGDARRVRAILKHLTEEHGVAIASSVERPYGIYLVESEEELTQYLAQLRGRALSILKRMAVLKSVHLSKLLGQMAMDLEKAES